MREKLLKIFANIGLFQAALSAYQLVQAWPGLAVKKEQAIREWLIKWIPISRTLADSTENTRDDALITNAESILSDDAAWSFFWRLLAAAAGLEIDKTVPAPVCDRENDPQFGASITWLLGLWSFIQQLIGLINTKDSAPENEE